MLETSTSPSLRARFSPDQRWIAYTSAESGRAEVYVVPFPGPGGKWLVSTGGGTWSRWRRDGKELFYLAPDNRLMAAEVSMDSGAFRVGAVRPLFETRPEGARRYLYDVSPDAQRFLVSMVVEQPTAAPITVVVNWREGLKQ